MLCEFEVHLYVVVPVEDLKESRELPGSIVIRRLFNQLTFLRATEDCGYFLKVTKVKSVGNGKLSDSSKYIIFPVTFYSRTFLPKTGEVLVGIVIKVCSDGVFLKCGPMNSIYLSRRKMPNYNYVSGENPFFLCDDHSRIENEVAVRFVVFAMRWSRTLVRKFDVLASIEGDCLGPISLNGLDGLEL
ncbi:DNA-directed RNA polymerase V subunit 7-like [Lycium barbarum]|uniref:DNA-directed RNA polymerase V subunit 7-like n=1 Tax=Lycium barbarum TaxID=112863 RepID=UPI00293F1A9A|nr:DNA-directed RNA polymerase V subunit 7-like [Lycium barbarum]XP_060180013.1 DNA-directed RNA polymerase V subunit 7-like [Lycium barbarum]XP_060180014.1 DNA-directed RNA polymerase V subunit 7-like [Lycium barbarum]XP_060180015.1 DNA-directed RNA polymerase V subunit 7-like [Lycium barbarum]